MGGCAGCCPPMKPSRRVGELEECNIFPPQVTQAAYALRERGALPVDIPLPTTVEGGSRLCKPGLCAPGSPYTDPAPGETTVSFRDVSLAYRSVKGEPRTVFEGLDLDIHKGADSLIGSNGAGKSTLMKLMVGLLKPNAGTVSLLGRPSETRRLRICPGRSPWSIRTRRRCSSRTLSAGTSPMPWRFGESRTGRCVRMHCCPDSGSPSFRTGMDACCPAGRCAGPAWPSGLPWIRRCCFGRAHRQPGHRHPAGNHGDPVRYEGHHSDRRHRNPRYAAGVPVGGSDRGATGRQGGSGRSQGPGVL